MAHPLAKNHYPQLPTHDEIGSMNICDFDSRVKEVEYIHRLSDEEVKYVKHAKRIIRNRFAARESRDKQKQLIISLQQRVAAAEKGFDISRHVTFALLKTNKELDVRITRLEKDYRSLQTMNDVLHCCYTNYIYPLPLTENCLTQYEAPVSYVPDDETVSM